jgi:hypothetical protein
LYYLDYYDVKVLLAVFFYKVLIERLKVSPGGHLLDKKLNVLAIAFGPESRLYPHDYVVKPVHAFVIGIDNEDVFFMRYSGMPIPGNYTTENKSTS